METIVYSVENEVIREYMKKVLQKKTTIFPGFKG